MPYQGLPILAVLVNSQTPPPIKISIIIKNSDQSMSGTMTLYNWSSPNTDPSFIQISILRPVLNILLHAPPL